MPADPRKRQKRLQRRTAKRQEKKHELVRQQAAGLGGRLTAAARYPVLHCWVMEALFAGDGMGQVLISRSLPNGFVAVAVFLVDSYCLGVKNALVDILPHSDYESKFVRKTRHSEVRKVAPALARKLVEDAVAYARDLGFSPHPDYLKARLIFGSIDASECTEQFEFGKDGKPLFIAGPHDSEQRCRFILNVLSRRCGPGGFNYVMPLGQGISRVLVDSPQQEDDGGLEEYGDEKSLEEMDDFEHDA